MTRVIPGTGEGSGLWEDVRVVWVLREVQDSVVPRGDWRKASDRWGNGNDRVFIPQDGGWSRMFQRGLGVLYPPGSLKALPKGYGGVCTGEV